MKKINLENNTNMLILLFSVTYMVSYITRINYGAVISEMETSTSISKTLLSMSLTGSFITYGAGQIISGICGDRFSPVKLISGGLAVTAIMNLIIPLCANPYQMLIVWCINGFAQSFIWPPIVRLMNIFLSKEDYKRASVKISWGSSVGTILVYLVSPLIIFLFSWKAVFVLSALCGSVMLFIWRNIHLIAAPESKKSIASDKNNDGKSFFSVMFMFIILAIILHGMLKDAVTTWMPSYISETYNLSNNISILTGVVIPIFSMICSQLSARLYIRKFTNPLMCSGVFFAVSVMSAVALLLFTGQCAALSVLFLALLIGCIHGVNLMLTCMIPPYFEKHGSVSTVSGILNSCTYVGSALSTYGTAVLSESAGWGRTLFTWAIIAVMGTLICMLCVKPWNNKMEIPRQS